MICKRIICKKVMEKCKIWLINEIPTKLMESKPESKKEIKPAKNNSNTTIARTLKTPKPAEININ